MSRFYGAAEKAHFSGEGNDILIPASVLLHGAVQWDRGTHSCEYFRARVLKWRLKMIAAIVLLAVNIQFAQSISHCLIQIRYREGIFYSEDGKTLGHIAQRGGRCSVPGNIQGQA